MYQQDMTRCATFAAALNISDVVLLTDVSVAV
jgi:hypothetical protein